MHPRQVMQIVVSAAFGLPSLFIILSKRFAPKDKHWAYATAGIIIGFWLHQRVSAASVAIAVARFVYTNNRLQFASRLG